MEKQDELNTAHQKKRISYIDLYEFANDNKDIPEDMYKLISGIIKFTEQIDNTYSEEQTSV